MDSTSSLNVNDLPAAERQTLEGLLGQPLSPDQRVTITAYTPSAASEESAREDAGEDPQRIFEKTVQCAAGHDVSTEVAEAGIEETMRYVRQKADRAPRPQRSTRTAESSGRVSRFTMC